MRARRRYRLSATFEAMLDRLAIYGVPALAGVVTAAVLIGPGREQQVIGARVWGVVAEGAESCALRVHTVLHYGGAYLSFGQPGVELTIESDGRVLGSWRGDTPASGLSEALVALAAPLTQAAVVRVTAQGELLAAGELVLVPPLEPVLPGDPSGAIGVKVPRGALAPPFPERVEVTAVTPTGDAKLDARADGADVRVIGASKQCDEERCRHRWRLEAKANAPAARLALAVAHAEGELRWEGELPVQNGAIWLDPESALAGELVLRAPAPHAEAFLSLFTPQGRVWGAIVPLTTPLDGMSHARVKLEPPEGSATLAIASDARDAETGWPLRPELGLVAPRPLARLADGMPALVAAEEARYRAARRPAYGLVLAAGLFELFFLWRKNRLARAALDAHLRARADAATAKHVAGNVPLLWLSFLAAVLALAFAILAAVAAWA